MSNLHKSVQEMTQIWHSLRSTWDLTRDSWKDTDRDQFKREHIQELTQATNSYIENLKRLAETTQRILSEMP